MNTTVITGYETSTEIQTNIFIEETTKRPCKKIKQKANTLIVVL